MYLLGAQWLNEPLRKQILGFLKSFTAWVYRQIIILDIFFALTVILCKYVALIALIGVWLTVFQSLE